MRVSLWTEVNREDRAVLETLQTALASKYATCGSLASDDYEGTIFDFTRYLAKQLESGSSEAFAARSPVCNSEGSR